MIHEGRSKGDFDIARSLVAGLVGDFVLRVLSGGCTLSTGYAALWSVMVGEVPSTNMHLTPESEGLCEWMWMCW